MRDEALRVVRDSVRDSVHIGVGFGVLALQRLQVHRRQIERRVRTLLPGRTA